MLNFAFLRVGAVRWYCPRAKGEKRQKQIELDELPQVVQTVQKQTTNGRKLDFKQQTDFVFQAESVLFLFEYDICCKS